MKCCPPALKLFLFNYIATPDARPDVPLDVVRCKLNSCVHTERAQVPEGPCNNDVLCTAPGPRECVCVRVSVCECAHVCVCELVMKPKPKWVSVSCSIPRPALLHSPQHSTRHCGHIFVHRECHFHVLLRIRDVGLVHRPHSVNSCRLCVYSS